MASLTDEDLNVLAIVITDVINGDLSGAGDLRYDMSRLPHLVDRLAVDTELMFENSGGFILPFSRSQS